MQRLEAKALIKEVRGEVMDEAVERDRVTAGGQGRDITSMVIQSNLKREGKSEQRETERENDYKVNHDDDKLQTSAPAASVADLQVGTLSSSSSSSSSGSTSEDPMRFSLSFAAAHYGQKDALRDAIAADKAHQDLKRRLEDVENLGPSPPIIEAIIPQRNMISSLFSKINKGFQRFRFGIQRGAVSTDESHSIVDKNQTVGIKRKAH